MARDTKKDGQSELRRSMVLTCQQSHKCFLTSLWLEFPKCRYDDFFVLESRNITRYYGLVGESRGKCLMN
jgi:hypothetical protein